MEGRFPGYEAFSPSAALLKALLITSTVSLSVRYQYESCIGPNSDIHWGPFASPDHQQGFGLLQLRKVFPPVPKDAPYFSFTNFTTMVFDNETVTSPLKKDAWLWNITVVDDSMDLRVTLAWTDPPG